MVLESIDEAHDKFRHARRDEVRARALRDHKDELGDRKIRRYRRQVDVVEGARFVAERLFSRGLAHLTAPRGRAQLERLASLRSGTQDLLASEQVEAHPEAEELSELLERGDALLGELIDELGEAVEDWEATSVELARTRDLFRFRRLNGVAQLGAIMGELRALLGGDVRAAYAYTSPTRRDATEPDPDLIEAAGDADDSEALTA